VLGPTPHRPGGPPLWIAGSLPASLERAGRHFDGWLPNGQDAHTWGEQWARINAIARQAGRDTTKLTGGMYLTAAVDDNSARAQERLDHYMEQYYGQPAALMRARQMSYAGPAAGFQDWLEGYAAAGVNHIVLRFAGDHERHLRTLADIRGKIGG
jgi:alkanesulfonate monooxygenase SsuD/methylene tetrahydromethanopterin reductase-like flavin-dependent oxidoreductase (luciferase family)